MNGLILAGLMTAISVPRLKMRLFADHSYQAGLFLRTDFSELDYARNVPWRAIFPMRGAALCQANLLGILAHNSLPLSILKSGSGDIRFGETIIQPPPLLDAEIIRKSGNTFCNRQVIDFSMGSAFSRVLLWSLSAVPSYGPALAQKPDQNAPELEKREPIISDEEFEKELPSLDAPAMESIEDWQKAEDATEQARQAAKETATPARQDGDLIEALPDPPVTDPLIDTPLPPIDSFDAEPPPAPTEDAEDSESRATRYSYRIDGLAEDGEMADIYGRIHSRFKDLSALESGDGRAENRSVVAARARADRQLLLDILSSEGFFDVNVEVAAERPANEGQSTVMVLTVVPGRRYFLGTIAFDAPMVEPVDLISSNFVPKTGDPIIADEIVGAEANISVKLPENGYPFAKVGQRDILLDNELGTGDYRLPVSIGDRSYFGKVLTEGKTAFNADHVAILRRFKTGDLYDSRKVDDLRAALVATGLLSMVSVEPIESGEKAPDGVSYADLLVRQEAGPARTLAASAGYGTGQGIRAEGSWTHRNIFPPEGALIASAILGTQEQAVGVTFRRSNAGKRDRIVELGLSASRNDFDAFEAYTGRLGGSISYVSTPIWQKKFTYSFGFELLATYESEYDFERAARDQQLYYVGALPAQVGFDTSDDLLNPTTGYRLNLRLSPETSLGNGSRFYLRSMLEGSFYQPYGNDLVLAARARVGSISGTTRVSLPPSRRYYGGGGGSVRGFGYQQLGPRDPVNDPIGGRSLNEAAIEARYRFGNFGVVGFVDTGQVYESSLPKFDDWRFGVGIGGRFYTNFGPLRLDFATPINRRTGESRIAVYVSFGQAF
jgi:translocation and assembly module TamA